jgi:hypothetical protein
VNSTRFLVRRAQQLRVAIWQREVPSGVMRIQFEVLAVLARWTGANQPIHARLPDVSSEWIAVDMSEAAAHSLRLSPSRNETARCHLDDEPTRERL